MHQLIASYLFQTRSCPLDSLGSLSITTTAADPDFTNKIINPPIPNILFQQNESPATGLTDFIADSTGCDETEATAALDHFYDQLKNDIADKGSAKLKGIGNLYVDSSDNLQFQQEELPDVFLQPVKANRVIHPQAEHHILVGDKESTNTLMTEYFNEEPVKKDRWWIWAIVLGVIAIILILVYLNGSTASQYFGNAVSYELA